MWKSVVDGQVLHFELAGINNQNFIMRDVETGSWWQQVSGEAIQGPLKGKQLELAAWDEVSYAIWKREHPESLVLLPDEAFVSNYKSPDWDKDFKDVETVVNVDEEAGLHARELIVGVEVGGRAKAYPLEALAQQSPVVDSLGGVPVLLVVDADGKSVRCFDRTMDGEALDLYRKAETESLRLVDAQTGSEWDFAGQALSGPLAGRKLLRIQTLKDFWFDWQLYHPETSIYSAGL